MIIPEDILQQVVFLSKDRKLAVIVKDRYFDLPGLSSYSGLGMSTLRKYMKVRGLPYYKLDGKLLIKKSAFDAWMQRFRATQEIDINKLADEAVRAVRGAK